MQGLTEVVPVSSSAHLALLPELLGWGPLPERTTVSAGLHAGSCLGIAWALRADLRALDRPTLLRLAATTVPAAAAGLLLQDVVEDRLGRPPQVAALLAGAGAALWLADRSGGSGPVTGRAAALAGLAQVVALAPGVSRGGATLTALRAAGVGRQEAARFSLLMSLPVTAGAAGLTLGRALVRQRASSPADDERGGRATDLEPGRTGRSSSPPHPDLRPLLSGVPAAAVTAALATRRLQRRPARSATGVALYRLALAAVVARRLPPGGPR